MLFYSKIYRDKIIAVGKAEGEAKERENIVSILEKNGVDKNVINEIRARASVTTTEASNGDSSTDNDE